MVARPDVDAFRSDCHLSARLLVVTMLGDGDGNGIVKMRERQHLRAMAHRLPCLFACWFVLSLIALEGYKYGA